MTRPFLKYFFSLWHARASKNPIFWKIQNKYSNETFYILKRLNTILTWANSEEFRRYSGFYPNEIQNIWPSMSKCMIVLVCVLFWRHSNPPLKRAFCKNFNGVYCLNKGGGGGGGGYLPRYFNLPHSKVGNVNINRTAFTYSVNMNGKTFVLEEKKT
jgi:hypothetical protein